MIWTLWFLNRQNHEQFIGSFFSAEEAEQHEREEIKSRKCAAWRFMVQGISPDLLDSLPGR